MKTKSFDKDYKKLIAFEKKDFTKSTIIDFKFQQNYNKPDKHVELTFHQAGEFVVKYKDNIYQFDCEHHIVFDIKKLDNAINLLHRFLVDNFGLEYSTNPDPENFTDWDGEYNETSLIFKNIEQKK